MKERILKRFDEDLAALERELKTELPKEIQRAREFGDLRENAEYQAAKERQTYVQARIAMLTRRRNEVALMNLDRYRTTRPGSAPPSRYASRAGRGSSTSWSCPKTPTPRRA